MPTIGPNATRPPHAMNPTSPCLPDAQPWATARSAYLMVLAWLFTFFNSVRLLSYLPPLWLIHQSGGRVHWAVAFNACNATMCALTVTLILAHRGWSV